MLSRKGNSSNHCQPLIPAFLDLASREQGSYGGETGQVTGWRGKAGPGSDLEFGVPGTKGGCHWCLLRQQGVVGEHWVS